MKDHIGPHDQLLIGTPVRVGNEYGHVVAVAYVPARPSGMIMVHTIEVTHKRVRGFGQTYKTVPLKKVKTSTVSYVGIYPLDKEYV